MCRFIGLNYHHTVCADSSRRERLVDSPGIDCHDFMCAGGSQRERLGAVISQWDLVGERRQWIYGT